MKKLLPAIALLLGGCWVRHHPIETFKPSAEIPATLAEVANDRYGRQYGARPCEAKDGRHYVSFGDQSGGLIRQWAYDAQTGKLVWVDEHPWEGTPCPCIDLMLPSDNAWGRKPEMECGVPIPATPEALRTLAPGAFGLPPE